MRAQFPVSYWRQRGGVAIFFALLIVALTASVAAAISYDMVLDTRRTQTLLWQEQARLVAYGAEDWIGDVLRQDAQDTESDHLGELWAQELPALPVEGAGMQGVITGTLIDLQSRFNLNNLVDNNNEPIEIEVERFRRLLRLLEIDPQVADAVVDWIDADTDITFPGGAEDGVYSNRLPPVLTANRAFRSINELALVEGLDKAALDRLRPHVCALPVRALINANTATPLVLQALDDNLVAADAQQILEDRFENGIDDLDVAFGGILPADAIGALDTSTQFFQLRSVVRIGTVRFSMYSLLHRSEQGDISILMRSFGNEY